VTASTTWLGDNAESALLYGTLVEAYTFQKGEVEMLNQYEERYQSALVGLANLGLMRLKRDDYRHREIRRDG